MPNVLAPTGLRPVRNLIAASPTYQATQRKILGTYGTTIGFGDVVAIGQAGATQGYVTLAADGAASVLGVLQGILPYFQSTNQLTINEGGWIADAGAPTTVNCMVIDSPFVVFQAQMVGGPFTNNMVGQNIDWTAGTNGAPGAGPARISTLSLASSSIGLANTLPFKIIGVADTIVGGPQDPTDTNPIIEVILNTSQVASSGGI